MPALVDHAAAMAMALEEARAAGARGEVPVGAVVLHEGHVVARSGNERELRQDPTAHAEVNALRAAASVLHAIDLSGCTLYSTCEPCPMCLAASHWSKVDRVVFGAGIGDATAAGFAELAVPAATLAALGRSLRYGIRLHLIVRETEGEAWDAAHRLIRHLSDDTIATAQRKLAQESDSVGQKRMLALHGGSRERLEIAPNT